MIPHKFFNSDAFVTEGLGERPPGISSEVDHVVQREIRQKTIQFFLGPIQFVLDKEVSDFLFEEARGAYRRSN